MGGTLFLFVLKSQRLDTCLDTLGDVKLLV